MWIAESPEHMIHPLQRTEVPRTIQAAVKVQGEPVKVCRPFVIVDTEDPNLFLCCTYGSWGGQRPSKPVTSR